MMSFRSGLHWGTRFRFLRRLVASPNFSLPLVTKSLVDLFLILGVITSPIFVDPFPVVFTVLSSVISDVLLVLLTIGSLAVDESFHSIVYVGFWESRRSLSAIVFVELGFALCSLHNMIVDLFTGNLLVILRYRTGAIHLVWGLANND